jgi:hypothetical protein
LLIKLLLLALILLPFFLFGYTLSDEPLVTEANEPSHYDIARLKSILKRHDPRTLQQGETGYAYLTEKDLNTLLLTSQSLLKTLRADSRIQSNTLTIALTTSLPDNQFGQYSNLSIELSNKENKALQINAIHFGKLGISGLFIMPVWNAMHHLLSYQRDYNKLANTIKTIQLSNDQLQVSYIADWNLVKDIQQSGQALLLSAQERDLLLVYQQQFIKILNSLSPGQSHSISAILQPMYQFASKHHAPASISPADENRLIFLMLAMYAANKDLNILLGEHAKAHPLPRHRRRLTLKQRTDLMQHFFISAFLASSTNSALANATGLFKEISDSYGGSGFSFADLAADRAGVRLGELAIASPSSAKHLQQQLAQYHAETDYMPSIKNLPEQLQHNVFKVHYGTTEDPRYLAMQTEVDRRLDRCELFKQAALGL